MGTQKLEPSLSATAPGPLMRISKVGWLCMTLLLTVTVLTWIPRLRGPIDLRWDAGVYYVLGTSLAEGRGYRLLYEPGEIQAVQYPPLLPAIVTVHEKLLGTSDPRVVGPWLRKSWFVLSLVYIVLVYFVARRFLTPRFALLLGLICALNSQMFFLSDLCFAELPFAFTTTLFFFLYYEGEHRPLIQWTAAAAAIASYLLRTLGITLLIAWVADALLRRKFRTAGIRAFIAVVPVFFWQSYVHRVEASYEYKHPRYAYQRDPSLFYNVSYASNVALRSPFQPESGRASERDLLSRFIWNAFHAPQSLGEELTFKKKTFEYYAAKLETSLGRNLVPHWLIFAALSGLGAVILVGAAVQLSRREWLVSIYTLLSIAAICTTPWPFQLLRYWAPLLPFLLLELFAGIFAIQRFVSLLFPSRERFFKPLISAPVLALTLCGSLLSLISTTSYLHPATYYTPAGDRRPYRLLYHPEVYSSVESSLQWILDRNRNSAAVIAVSLPGWVYLKTGMPTVMAPFERGKATVLVLLDSVPVSYVVLGQMLFDDSYNSNFDAIIRSSPDKWKLAYASPLRDVEVYERIGISDLASAQSPVRGARLLF